MSDHQYVSTAVWFLIYLLLSLYTKWVVSWGGASFLESWTSFWNSSGYFHQTTEEQIKLATKWFWLGITVWFVIGLFIPEVRLKL